jgi:hypothetical protein
MSLPAGSVLLARLPFVPLSWAALLWVALPSLAAPLPDQCDRQLPPAHIEVRARFAEPAISFALSAREIKPLSGTTLPGVSLGLTQVQRRVEQRVSLSTLRSKLDGRACARPHIELTLALYQARVYVASELAGNDCAVAAVWHHELRHFAIYQETLMDTAREVEGLMRAHYDGLILAGTEDEIRAQIERDLGERWLREIDALAARGNIEHELLDARDAQSDTAWCDGALLRLGDLLVPDPQ